MIISATSSLLCLAANIYFEARGDGVTSQWMVAHATLNRSLVKEQSVCSIVTSKKQFSWTNERVKFNRKLNVIYLSKLNEKAWAQAKTIAGLTLRYHQQLDFTDGATHYHSVRIRPNWAKNHIPGGVAGRHVFYRGIS